MSSSNRVQLVSVKEVTVGATPGTPRMRTRRDTGEGLKWTPTFVDSEERRSDRMNTPPIKVGEDSGGDIKFELSYPFPDTPADVDIQSAMYNTWNDTNSRDNDGTADSVITDIATINEVLTVTTGVAFVAKALYRFTGFGVTLNNGVFACTTASATVPRFVGAGLTNETAPPAAARVKEVGFIGDSGDINATSTGLSSTTTNFTTFASLAVGKWIKIGGTGAGKRFVTEALNDWARVIGITATALTLDNRPSGWTTETGTALTIKVWCSDQIKNGATQIGQTIEKGFLGQTVPTYITQPGMVVSQYSMDLQAKAKITGSVAYMGMTGANQDTAALDASPDAATSLTSFPVMACSANVGRIGEAGATLAAPNFVKGLNFQIANNITPIEAVDTMGAAGLTGHKCDVSGQINTYFGDNSLLTKFFAGTLTSLNGRVVKDSRAFIVTLPQITYNGDGSPNASAGNQDVMLPLGFKASKEETYTNAQILFDRLEYYEA